MIGELTEGLIAAVTAWQQSPWLPVIVIVGYILGSALFIPITALILSTAYIMSPIAGACCSLIGVASGSLVGYWFGRLAGKARVEKIVPKRMLEKVRSALRGNEVLSVAIIRKLPIAPFTVVNMVLGALKVPPLHFALGSALGMTPAIVLVAIFDRSYEYAMENPSWTDMLLIGILIIAALGVAFLLQQFLPSRSKESATGAHS